MYLYRVRSRVGELFYHQFGMREHQMNIQGERRVAFRKRDSRGAETQIRHEHAVHYVEVEFVRARVFGASYFIREAPEVGGKERWEDFQLGVKS